MRTFKVVVDTGFVGCDMWDTFEVDDDATMEEIEEIALEVKENLTCNWILYEESENDE